MATPRHSLKRLRKVVETTNGRLEKVGGIVRSATNIKLQTLAEMASARESGVTIKWYC